MVPKDDRGGFRREGIRDDDNGARYCWGSVHVRSRVEDPFGAGAFWPSAGPFLSAKGTGLSLMIDILSGLLSGTSATGEVANLFDSSRPAKTAHFLLAIDPAAFVGAEEFDDAVAGTTARIEAMEPVDGTRVLLPGQLEFERSLRIAAEGVELPQDVRADLDAIAAALGIEPLGS